MRITLLLIALFLSAQVAFAGNLEIVSPGYLSFEDGIFPVRACRGSSLKISPHHFKTGKTSLEWTWHSKGASIVINQTVPYLSKNPNPRETSVSSFVFWVYSPKKMKGDLRVDFLKGKKVCCGFTYHLGFAGWRGAWVAFDRDMEGSPEEGMDAIRISVAGTPKCGKLFFDGIIPSAFEDVRYHTADFQAPFINEGTDVHWLLLLKHWQKKLDVAEPDSIDTADRAYMDSLSARFLQMTAGGKKPWKYEDVKAAYEKYDISFNPDGSICGKPIFFTRYAETYYSLGVRDAAKILGESNQLLRRCNDDLFQIALCWKNSEGWKKADLERMYLNLIRHLLDQGFAAGSAQGTLHHLGYSMRNFYTGPVIMRDVLGKAGLLEEVQKAMEWFSGVGEVKIAPETQGMDIDAFNTSLMGRFASLLMLEDGPYKFAYLKAFSRWVDNGLRTTSGLKPCLKPDGTVFHHRRAYPAYAVGGLDGAVKAVYMLRESPFAVSEDGYANLKNALMQMRFYCNLLSFPLAMSGRHPDGKGALIPEQYALLALAGNDEELSEAYLRLEPAGKYASLFGNKGFKAEKSPTGVRSYGYNSSLSVREDDWLVHIAGHSRYLWAAEIYEGANLYGRYITHGSLQILGDGDPVSAEGSGFCQKGWDWCHIPGTTAAEIPMEKMQADVLNVDEYSGYEEMLLSDEWFAGGVGRGDSGAYAMILHEHDKYNGSLRAHKSFFAFGNRIVALGSGLQNTRPGSSLHTTLFQNHLDTPAETSCDTLQKPKLLRDRFGNVWFPKDATVVLRRGLQNSLDEETAEPAQGYFEKAYIHHWTTGESGPDNYEYLLLVHPSEEQVSAAAEELPYKVVSCTDALHEVVDLQGGQTAAAVFENTAVDGVIAETTPCMLMYSLQEGILDLAVSNPDLALYEGPSDEIYKDGKRVERSIYSRRWVDADCAPTAVTMTIFGKWSSEPAQNLEIRYIGDNTRITIHTAEGRTEKVKLYERK